MSEAYNPQLKLGTVGWEQGFEQSGFFPEDLPQDWRLTYLSNELDRVAIPLSVLEAVEPEAVEAWAEDVHEQFGFYLLLPDEVEGQRRERALRQLSPLEGQLLGGITVQPVTLEGVEGVCSLQCDGAVAVVETRGELSPMAMRRLIERLNELEADTLLFVPGSGLVANLANAETITSLLR